MKFLTIIYLLMLNVYQHDLDYPRNADDIAGVELLRPDKVSKGKFAKIKKLSGNEVKQLLFVLGNAKPTGKKFHVDYYIVFTTKNNVTKKLMINKDKVKGYNDEQVYEIRPLSLLLEF